MLIHSYVLCQPLGILDHFQLTFIWPDNELCVLLLVVLSPLERKEVQEGPDRFHCSKKHCKFNDAFKSPDLKNFMRDKKKKS